jgi:hypothetical protein
MRLPSVAPVLLVASAACNDSDGFTSPDLAPQIVTVSGPQGGVVTCDPATAGGNCPLPLAITFRLPQGQVVTKAYVRFLGNGSDTGVPQGYTLPPTMGDDATNVVVNVAASIPPTILGTGSLFTYAVRLVTGIGKESSESTLTVSVQ